MGEARVAENNRPGARRVRRPFLTTVGVHLLRHLSLLTFALIAVVLLTGPAHAPARAQGDRVMLVADADVDSGPATDWARILAGSAALVAATFDGITKVRQPARASVCPFRVDGVARCHGQTAPVPPANHEP